MFILTFKSHQKAAGWKVAWWKWKIHAVDKKKPF